MLLPKSLRDEIGDRAARTAVVENHGPKNRRLTVILYHYFLAHCQALGVEPVGADHR